MATVSTYTLNYSTSQRNSSVKLKLIKEGISKKSFYQALSVSSNVSIDDFMIITDEDIFKNNPLFDEQYVLNDFLITENGILTKSEYSDVDTLFLKDLEDMNKKHVKLDKMIKGTFTIDNRIIEFTSFERNMSSLFGNDDFNLDIQELNDYLMGNINTTSKRIFILIIALQIIVGPLITKITTLNNELPTIWLYTPDVLYRFIGGEEPFIDFDTKLNDLVVLIETSLGLDHDNPLIFGDAYMMTYSPYVYNYLLNLNPKKTINLAQKIANFIYMNKIYEQSNYVRYIDQFHAPFSLTPVIGAILSRGIGWPYKSLTNRENIGFQFIELADEQNSTTVSNVVFADPVVESSFIRQDVDHFTDTTLNVDIIKDRLKIVFPELEQTLLNWGQKELFQKHVVFAGGAPSICASEFLWEEFHNNRIDTDIDLFIIGENNCKRRDVLKLLLEDLSKISVENVLPTVTCFKSVVKIEWLSKQEKKYRERRERTYLEEETDEQEQARRERYREVERRSERLRRQLLREGEETESPIGSEEESEAEIPVRAQPTRRSEEESEESEEESEESEEESPRLPVVRPPIPRQSPRRSEEESTESEEESEEEIPRQRMPIRTRKQSGEEGEEGEEENILGEVAPSEEKPEFPSYHRIIQIMCTDSQNPEEILYNFDMSHIQIGLSNDKIVTTPEYLHYTARNESLIIRNNIRIHRLIKAMRRGFTPVMMMPFTRLLSSKWGIFKNKSYLFRDQIARIEPCTPKDYNHYFTEYENNKPDIYYDREKFPQLDQMIKITVNSSRIIPLERKVNYLCIEAPNVKESTEPGIINVYENIKMDGRFRNAFDGYIGHSVNNLTIKKEFIYTLLSTQESDYKPVAEAIKKNWRQIVSSKENSWNINLRNITLRPLTEREYNDMDKYPERGTSENRANKLEYMKNNWYMMEYTLPVVIGKRTTGYQNIYFDEKKKLPFVILTGNLKDELMAIIIDELFKLNQQVGSRNYDQCKMQHNGEVIHQGKLFLIRMAAPVFALSLKYKHLDMSDTPILKDNLDPNYIYEGVCRLKTVEDREKYEENPYHYWQLNQVMQFWLHKSISHTNPDITGIVEMTKLEKTQKEMKETEAREMFTKTPRFTHREVIPEEKEEEEEEQSFLGFTLPIKQVKGGSKWLKVKNPENYSVIENIESEPEEEEIKPTIRQKPTTLTKSTTLTKPTLSGKSTLSEKPVPSAKPTTLPKPVPSQKPTTFGKPVPSVKSTTLGKPALVAKPTTSQKSIPSQKPTTLAKPATSQKLTKKKVSSSSGSE